MPVFTCYNFTLNGEKGACIFICCGKFAWENRAPLFVKLPKCISLQCPPDQVRVPWGQLDKTQLHMLLTGALSSDEFCWSNSLDRPLLDLPYCS